MGDLATIALRAGPLLVAAWAGCSMLCAVRLLLQMPKRSHVLWKKHLLRFCWLFCMLVLASSLLGLYLVLCSLLLSVDVESHILPNVVGRMSRQ